MSLALIVTLIRYTFEHTLISKAVKQFHVNEPCPFVRNESAEIADVGHCRQR